jgi:hypothetical protein
VAQIIRKIGNWETIAEHTRKLSIDNSRPETAYCAKNRNQFWLQFEPNYSSGTYKTGITDDRLWRFIKRICPSADLAQVFGGNKAIDWHRDASYANSTAWLLALGRSTFEIELRSGELRSIALTGGEPIEFDCKNRHRATDVDPGRIGIGIWFNSFEQSCHRSRMDF